jgi:hypothetical protein
MGDEYALTGGYEELINCLVCSKEYDRVEYRSDTCSDCEDEMIKREGKSVSKYEYIDGDGDTITCDNCNNLFANWYANDYHAICKTCFLMEVLV